MFKFSVSLRAIFFSSIVLFAGTSFQEKVDCAVRGLHTRYNERSGSHEHYSGYKSIKKSLKGHEFGELFKEVGQYKFARERFSKEGGNVSKETVEGMSFKTLLKNMKKLERNKGADAEEKLKGQVEKDFNKLLTAVDTKLGAANVSKESLKDFVRLYELLDFMTARAGKLGIERNNIETQKNSIESKVLEYLKKDDGGVDVNKVDDLDVAGFKLVVKALHAEGVGEDVKKTLSEEIINKMSQAINELKISDNKFDGKIVAEIEAWKRVYQELKKTVGREMHTELYKKLIQNLGEQKNSNANAELLMRDFLSRVSLLGSDFVKKIISDGSLEKTVMEYAGDAKAAKVIADALKFYKEKFGVGKEEINKIKKR